MIEIDVVRYGDGQSTSSWDALSAIASTSLSLAYEPYPVMVICHEKTTMTSQTSENTIFVRVYFTRWGEGEMRYEMVCLRISIIMPNVIYAFAITFYEVKFISLSHPSYVISCIIIPFHW